MNKTLGWKLGSSLQRCWFSCLASLAFRRTFSAQGCWRRMQDRIHLGLDLKGGTHLILQVQVNDAVNADSDTLSSV